jgi:hypothetical protein
VVSCMVVCAAIRLRMLIPESCNASTDAMLLASNYGIVSLL